MIARSLTLCLGLAILFGASDAAWSQQSTDTAKAKSRPSEPKAAGAAKGKGEKAGAKKAAKTEGKIERATFGGGCFWCLEAVFETIPGVKAVISGYSGGDVPNPSYEQVCSGETGHAEVVRIEFDPDVVAYDKLLDVFWICHDPTSLNHQGPDFGTQYRSVIFYHNDAQKEAAEKSAKKLTSEKAFANPIVTDLVPEAPFFVAEAYHQDYYRKHKTAPYCRINIAPKLKKLKSK